MINFWHAFTVAPNKERSAADELGRRGMLPLVPLWPKAKRKGPSTGYKRTPVLVIPGYVFVFIEPTWQAIRQVLAQEFIGGDKCVNSIVMGTAGIPGRITEEVMKEFLQHIAQSEPTSTVKQSFKVGGKARVKDGAFHGFKGVVQRVEGDRVCILTELFKRSTLVVVSVHSLELDNEGEKTSVGIGKNLHCGANQSTRYGQDGGRFATGGKSRIDRQSHRAKTG